MDHFDQLHAFWSASGAAGPALAAAALAIAALLTVYLLMRRTLGQLRAQLGTELARVFEQLDLLRFDSQERHTDPGTQPSPARAAEVAYARREGAVRPLRAADYQSAMLLAERGAPLTEITARCRMDSAELRLLLAVQQARRIRGAA